MPLFFSCLLRFCSTLTVMIGYKIGLNHVLCTTAAMNEVTREPSQSQDKRQEAFAEKTAQAIHDKFP
jgi:hypothetical protein